MTKRKIFTWPRFFRFLIAAYIGLSLGFLIKHYAEMKGELSECITEIEELNKVIDSHCTSSELRLLSCHGRLDGCLCAPLVPKETEYEE